MTAAFTRDGRIRCRTVQGNDSAVAHISGRGNRTSGPSRRWDGAAPDAKRPMNEVSHELERERE
jgi:hypothetical protein